MQAIYVDQGIMERVEARYRFSLAHEVGHMVLHRRVFEEQRIDCIEAWKDFMDRVDLGDYSRIEFQAYAFAACLLVPKRHLGSAFRRELTELDQMISEARSLGFSKVQYLSNALETIADRLRRTFNVSSEVLVRRMDKDGLADLIP